MEIMVGGTKWNALQAILDERKDCIDRIHIMDALQFEARIYKKPTPFREDYLTGEWFLPLEVVVSAMQNYCDITLEEAANL